MPAPPPLLFGLLAVSMGVTVSIAKTFMPYAMRNAGVTISSIGWFVALAKLPFFFKCFYAGIVDIGFRRQTWMLLFTSICALAAGLSVLAPLPSQVNTFLVLLLIAQIAASFLSACYGGLASSLLGPDERDKAAGWIAVGGVLGGLAGAAVTIRLYNQVPDIALAALITLVILAPASGALLIDEPRQPTRRLRQIVNSLVQEFGQTLKTREGWTCIIFALCPNGATALPDLLSALAPDYHLTPSMLAVAMGPLGIIATVLGSLAGGYLCARFDRRWVYLISGPLIACADLSFLMAPLRPASFFIATAVIMFFSAFAYSAFYSMILWIASRAQRTVSAQFSILIAAGNVAEIYVGLISTRFYARFGLGGLIGSDAAMNIFGALLVFYFLRGQPQKTEWSRLNA